MKILIACEFTGLVRDAFIARGHDALSCDFLPTEQPGPHYQGNVLDLLSEYWDMMIAFPPCTYLTSSGARFFEERKGEQRLAVKFVKTLWHSSIRQIAIENPVGVLSKRIRKPDQIIQPYQYGDPARKSTCLWLKRLPKLEPTNIVEPEVVELFSGVYSKDRIGWSTKERSKERSKTYPGIAKAMAEQWSRKEVVTGR